jgi:hypothetical protein
MSVALSATGRAARSQPAVPRKSAAAKLERAWLVDRAAKTELVATLNGVFKGTNVVVVARN